MEKLAKNQSGVAAIIIVTVIISIMTLIVLSFSSLIRREQRQALDQQISAQARYAAETAINEKIALFYEDPSSVPSTLSKDCENSSSEPTFSGSASDEIQTTCVVINSSPTEIIKKTSPDQRSIFWLDPSVNLDKLVVKWQLNEDNVGDCTNIPYGNHPDNLDSSYIGMLRFDIARLGQVGQADGSVDFTRQDLTSSLLGGIMVPSRHSTRITEIPYNAANNAEPVAFGACDHPSGLAGLEGIPSGYRGAYAIIDMPSPSNRDHYVLTTRNLYNTTLIEVIGFDNGGNRVAFDDAQISLEATARVNDVYQRVQVRAPSALPPYEIVPNNAMHVTNGGLCKLIESEPGNTTTAGCN